MPKDKKWKQIKVCNPCTGGVIEYNGSYDCSGTGWQPYYKLKNSEICFPNNPDDLTSNLYWRDFQSEFNYTSPGYCQRILKKTFNTRTFTRSRQCHQVQTQIRQDHRQVHQLKMGVVVVHREKNRKTSTCDYLSKDTCDQYANQGCKWVQSEDLCK